MGVDDGASSPIDLPSPFPFGESAVSTAYVSTIYLPSFVNCVRTQSKMTDASMQSIIIVNKHRLYGSCLVWPFCVHVCLIF